MPARGAGGIAAALAAAVVLVACGGGSTTSKPVQDPGSAGRSAPGCPAGADPDRSGPQAQPRPPASGDLLGLLPAAVDVDSRMLVALAGAETWTLDLCTNTWQQRRPATGPRSIAELQLVYDADSDVVLSWSPRERAAWAYDADRDEWTELGPPPATSSQEWADPVYDPGTGLVVLRDGATGALWSYDVDTDNWRRLAGPAASHNGGTETHHFASLMVADPARHQLILVLTDPAEEGRTWLFDLDTREWTRLDAIPPNVITGYQETGGEMVFDEAAGEAVLLGLGVMAAFDPETETWRDVVLGEPLLTGSAGPPDQLTGAAARAAHTLVYDPLNDRVLLLGGRQRQPDERSPGGVGWVDATAVWAFDTTGNRWFELVPTEP